MRIQWCVGITLGFFKCREFIWFFLLSQSRFFTELPNCQRKLKNFFSGRILDGFSEAGRGERVKIKDSPFLKLIARKWFSVYFCNLKISFRFFDRFMVWRPLNNGVYSYYEQGVGWFEKQHELSSSKSKKFKKNFKISWFYNFCAFSLYVTVFKLYLYNNVIKTPA